MTIYLDPARPTAPADHCPWKGVCRLFTEPGQLVALHGFAARLGVAANRFANPRTGLPHYLIPAAWVSRAAKQGAVRLDSSATHLVVRRWRSQRGL